MREWRTSGSVGATGEQSPTATQPIKKMYFKNVSGMLVTVR